MIDLLLLIKSAWAFPCWKKSVTICLRKFSVPNSLLNEKQVNEANREQMFGSVTECEMEWTPVLSR